MAKFRVNPTLTQQVATQIVAPHVTRLAERVRDGAAQAAPRVKVWQTQQDERVRPWHVTAHNRAVPDNLRFELDAAPYRGNQHPQGHDYLREPRDPSGSPLQVQDCRCFLGYNNDLARSITAHPAEVQGSRVIARVSTGYPRAAESNVGTADDAPAAFMERGIHAAARGA